MKLKRLPEDFEVEEATEFAPAGGEFSFYRLRKRSLGTPEAIDLIARAWKLARHRISYGGKKDRHAVTTQHLTIRHGPKRDLERDDLDLQYVGAADRPFGPRDITANRFRIVLRSLSDEEADCARANLPAVTADGLPNYFDDQRFGSVPPSGEFIARAGLDDDYERALRLALAEPLPDDRRAEREQKQRLRDTWGDWPAAKQALARSHRRSVVTYLCDRPDDFRGAWARIKADLRGLYLSAYQSHLWNCVLAALLRERCPAESLVPVELKTATVPFFTRVEEPLRRELHELAIPLPSSRSLYPPGTLADLVERTLADAGVSLERLKIRFPKDSYFSKADRPAVVIPAGLSHRFGDDELDPAREKLTLSFELPRGAYATLLVKRLMVGS